MLVISIGLACWLVGLMSKDVGRWWQRSVENESVVEVAAATHGAALAVVQSSETKKEWVQLRGVMGVAWSTSLPGQVNSSAHRWGTAVEDGLAVVRYIDANGVAEWVNAYDANTGMLLWTTHLRAFPAREWGWASEPPNGPIVITGDTVIVPVHWPTAVELRRTDGARTGRMIDRWQLETDGRGRWSAGLSTVAVRDATGRIVAVRSPESPYGSGDLMHVEVLTKYRGQTIAIGNLGEERSGHVLWIDERTARVERTLAFDNQHVSMEWRTRSTQAGSLESSRFVPVCTTSMDERFTPALRVVDLERGTVTWESDELFSDLFRYQDSWVVSGTRSLVAINGVTGTVLRATTRGHAVSARDGFLWLVGWGDGNPLPLERVDFATLSSQFGTRLVSSSLRAAR